MASFSMVQILVLWQKALQYFHVSAFVKGVCNTNFYSFYKHNMKLLDKKQPESHKQHEKLTKYSSVIVLIIYF